MDFPIKNWWFSIAMLNYQRVTNKVGLSKNGEYPQLSAIAGRRIWVSQPSRRMGSPGFKRSPKIPQPAAAFRLPNKVPGCASSKIYESYLIHEIYSNLRYNMIQQIENVIKMINAKTNTEFSPLRSWTLLKPQTPRSYRQVFHSKHA